MVKVNPRFTHLDTPNDAIKHFTTKARRRQNVEEVRDSLLASVEESAPVNRSENHSDIDGAPQRVAAAVLIWDDGLDYNMDGTSYQDDAPGDFPHSYHHSLKEAQIAVAYLENGGCDPERITIVEDFLVSPWDVARIPLRD